MWWWDFGLVFRLFIFFVVTKATKVGYLFFFLLKTKNVFWGSVKIGGTLRSPNPISIPTHYTHPIVHDVLLKKKNSSRIAVNALLFQMSNFYTNYLYGYNFPTFPCSWSNPVTSQLLVRSNPVTIRLLVRSNSVRSQLLVTSLTSTNISTKW